MPLRFSVINACINCWEITETVWIIVDKSCILIVDAQIMETDALHFRLHLSNSALIIAEIVFDQSLKDTIT